MVKDFELEEVETEQFDAEFEREYQEATRRGAETLRTEPRARNAFYDRENRRIVIELLNDCTFSVPPALVQGLSEADDAQLAAIEIFPFGLALNWTELDVQHEVGELMRGHFGNRQWMAKLSAAGQLKQEETPQAA